VDDTTFAIVTTAMLATIPARETAISISTRENARRGFIIKIFSIIKRK